MYNDHMSFAKLYIISLISFLLLDGFWIGFVASSFYKKHLGFLLSPKVNYLPVAIFYLIYVFGIVYVVLEPNMGRSLVQVFITGAIVGLMAYSAYDFTNQATIKDWPIIITIVDILWGAFASGAVSVITMYIAQNF